MLLPPEGRDDSPVRGLDPQPAPYVRLPSNKKKGGLMSVITGRMVSDEEVVADYSGFDGSVSSGILNGLVKKSRRVR
jgi:hypothetical protein